MTDGRTGLVGYVDPEHLGPRRLMVAAAAVNKALEQMSGALAGPRTTAIVFTWNFVSSAFVHFTHHVHSFVDTTWDHPAAAPLEQVDLDSLAALVDAAGNEAEYTPGRHRYSASIPARCRSDSRFTSSKMRADGMGSYWKATSRSIGSTSAPVPAG